MELIFLRHGQTDWNKLGILQGRSDIGLNEDGIKSAKRAGAILSATSFDGIYCSPLIRAKQTLQFAFPNGIPVYDDRLTERNFGCLEGKKAYQDSLFQNSWYLNAPPVQGAESIEDVIARVKDFYKEVRRLYPNGRILVVSHGGVSAALNCVINGLPESGSLFKYVLPNSVPVLFREGQAPICMERAL